MDKHYIYSWNIIDENGILHPFYIGAGHNTRRADYSRSKRPHLQTGKRKTRAQYKREKHSENFYILIEFDNLTLEDRNKIEISLISQYGRIQYGGCLLNYTPGGDSNPMFDPYSRLVWEKTIPEMQMSQPNRKEIEYNGTIYISKKEASRRIGISSQLLNYRLKNCIPLDLKPDHGNDPNNKRSLRKRK